MNVRGRKQKRKPKRRRTAPAVLAEAREAIAQLERLEREHVPILPEHPKPH